MYKGIIEAKCYELYYNEFENFKRKIKKRNKTIFKLKKINYQLKEEINILSKKKKYATINL